jgi:hypothetical protein
MKNLYTLQGQIQELNDCLKHNTVELRQAHNNAVRLVELLHARTQIILSIAHRQAETIRIYENALMNVTPIRKAS